MPKIRVLLVMEQCNPEWPSVPRLAYHFFRELKKRADVTLCTHGRNQANIEKVRQPQDKIVYFPESRFSRNYYRLISPLMHFQGTIWPLAHSLSYPIYAEFNRAVDRRFRDEVRVGAFDVVHAMTPIIPRYPVKIIEACQKTPFVLGPVNGGIPYPSGFEAVAKKEWAFFNFLRCFSRWIPGYAKTYKRADKVLVGSKYTGAFLKEELHLSQAQLELFPENGVEKDLFADSLRLPDPSKTLQLLFVGRLVPYKGADLLIQALSRLDKEVFSKVYLKIAGDGEERSVLMQLAEEKGLREKVIFAGWIDPQKMKKIYEEADIFCFPSIREFGGAVILEAMAAGLPSVVVDYGGIGEYTTDKTSIKIVPRSTDFIIQELTSSIKTLVEDPSLRMKMGLAAVEQARSYEWGRKADQLVLIYEQLMQANKNAI